MDLLVLATIPGGGAVGCELAQVYAGFGAEVTLVEAGPQLVSGEDAAIARKLAGVLRRDGVNVRLDAGVKAVEPAPDGHTRVLLDEGPAIEAQQLILAVGRTPATTGLGRDGNRAVHAWRQLPGAGTDGQPAGRIPGC